MKPANTLNLIGHRYDRLTVISQASHGHYKHTMWECQCECGETTVRRGDYLKIGKNQSCGCSRNLKHGMSLTPTGSSWKMMLQRCFNPKNPEYFRYGAAGRTVCEFIRASPLNLVLLIGHRPPGTSIDRTNNSGSYTCGECAQCIQSGWKLNVRWATPKQQYQNRGICT